MAEYIERGKIKFHRTGFEERCHNDRWTEYVDIAFKSEVEAIPAADVRPVVRGEWGYRWKIHGDGRRPTELFPCTVCGFENTSATNFCPNCGADMREES